MKKYELKDPLIVGEIAVQDYNPRKITCDHCGQKTLGIRIDNVLLPPGMSPSNTLIVCRKVGNIDSTALFDWINFIGINCGCYARAHRQIAIVETKLAQKRSR